MTTIKELFSMMKDMDDQVKMMEDFTKTDVENHGFNFSIIGDITRFTKDQINEFTPEVLMNIQNHYGLKAEESTESISYDEKAKSIRENLLDIYDGVKSYLSLLKDRNNIVKDVEHAMKDYSDYLSSDEVKKKDEENLRELQSKIDNETDPKLKAAYQKKLDIISNSDSLEFILQRMKTLGKKELDNIVDSFFNNKKFQYIIQRYEEKSRRLGYKPELYKALTDIEEKFLGEEYYPFNNLFLFIMLRFIAYADVNNDADALYCQSIIVKVSKLVYHKYNNDGEKEIVVNFIRMVDDYFQDYKELFVEKNEGNPLSSYRIELEKKRKEQSIKNLKEMFIDRNLVYDEEKSYEENLHAMHDIVEKEQLINWFDIYGIKYPEDASLEDLRTLKESFNTQEDEATDEEVSETEKSEEEASSDGFEPVDETEEIPFSDPVIEE